MDGGAPAKVLLFTSSSLQGWSGVDAMDSEPNQGPLGGKAGLGIEGCPMGKRFCHKAHIKCMLLLLLLSHFSRVQLCATP